MAKEITSGGSGKKKYDGLSYEEQKQEQIKERNLANAPSINAKGSKIQSNAYYTPVEFQKESTAPSLNAGNQGVYKGSFGVEPTVYYQDRPTQTPTTDQTDQSGSGNTPSGSGGSPTGGSSSPTQNNASNGTPTAPQAASTPGMGGYDPISDAAYQQALSALQAANGAPPTYAGTYEPQLASLYEQIVSREPFKYDLNADMLYQQYAQQYYNKGKLAMQDTMGQAAALTGGYGSSYGQMVGQQQFDSYLQNINDAIPEFYDRAYQEWLDRGNDLQQQYAMTGDLANQEYDRYLDSYNQWLNEREYRQDLADQAYQRGYNQWSDNYNMALDKASLLGKAGDFSGYADVYGSDAAQSLQNDWIYNNPDIAYRNGLLTPEDYYAMTGQYPAGYTPPQTASYGGGNRNGNVDFNTTDGTSSRNTPLKGTNAYTINDYVNAARNAYNSGDRTGALGVLQEGIKAGDLSESQRDHILKEIGFSNAR